MNEHLTRARSASRTLAALLAIIIAPVAWNCIAAEPPLQPPGHTMLAQSAMPGSAPATDTRAAAAATSNALTWTFAAAQPATAAAWTAEVGRLSFDNGETRLQPDRNRRVVLLSPPALPDAVRTAETFVLGVPGTGLQRVRIKARRDARGGWITIVDASGTALRETPDGYVVKRRTGPRDVPIERLHFEFDFRSTNTRPLQNIVAR